MPTYSELGGLFWEHCIISRPRICRWDQEYTKAVRRGIYWWKGRGQPWWPIRVVRWDRWLRGMRSEPAIWGKDLEREQKARVAVYSPEARGYLRAMCYHIAVWLLLTSYETTQAQTMTWRESELVANSQVFAHSLSSYISCGFGLFQMLRTQKCLTPDRIYFWFWTSVLLYSLGWPWSNISSSSEVLWLHVCYTAWVGIS